MRYFKLLVLMFLFSCQSRESIEYYPNGSIKERYYTKKGLRYGEFVEYYENGSIKEKGVYQENKKILPRYTFYDDGRKEWEINREIVDTTFESDSLGNDQIIKEVHVTHFIGKYYARNGALKTSFISNKDSIFVYSYDTLSNQLAKIDTVLLNRKNDFKFK